MKQFECIKKCDTILILVYLCLFLLKEKFNVFSCFHVLSFLPDSLSCLYLCSSSMTKDHDVFGRDRIICLVIYNLFIGRNIEFCLQWVTLCYKHFR